MQFNLSLIVDATP